MLSISLNPYAALRMIKSDLGKLDRLTEVFYEKALSFSPTTGAP